MVGEAAKELQNACDISPPDLPNGMEYEAGNFFITVFSE
jgi:hypothetical protein